jgi:hypothetical protein
MPTTSQPGEDDAMGGAANAIVALIDGLFAAHETAQDSLRVQDWEAQRTPKPCPRDLIVAPKWLVLALSRWLLLAAGAPRRTLQGVSSPASPECGAPR